MRGRMPDRCRTYNRIINIPQVPYSVYGISERVHIAFLQLSIPSKLDLHKFDTCSEIPYLCRVRS
jgi:hypothetical protein